MKVPQEKEGPGLDHTAIVVFFSCPEKVEEKEKKGVEPSKKKTKMSHDPSTSARCRHNPLGPR